ncbi:uncharacterized protein LOC133824861 [Humulus lupulus]|uniref:uncharacterized protein LOC133824861 n=1 Tax=Humulus lupulus TaxID=3486 RepID=UPI002B41051C|nr:uncharacterized protein LOC133824861 [Humulus lupulus]
MDSISSQPPSPSSSNIDRNKNHEMRQSYGKELFNYIMKGEWDKVVELYNAKPKAHGAKVTNSGHTALHLAISDYKEDVVELLVNHIREKNTEDVLGIKNEQGCTPLHFAVSMGSVRMCQCILDADNSLIGVQNNKGETPLFWAVLYGQKEAFLCLDYYCRRFWKDKFSEQAYTYCRRNDGENILHCAIMGEYFDLALHIIDLYKDLINYRDEKGFLPLQTLATKSSAFKSSHTFGRWDKFIYNCILVEELKIEHYDDKKRGGPPNEKTNCYPKNYQVCANFFELLKRAIQVVTNTGGCKSGECLNCDLENNAMQSHSESSADRFCSLNNIICVEFAKLICKAFLVVVGLGYSRIHKLREDKLKHTYAVQLLEKLLDSTTMYEHSGSRQPGTNVDDEELYNINENGEFEKGEGNDESALLLAAKNGIVEMVERILQLFPVAILDVNRDKKNIFLLAVENRRLKVLKILKETTDIYSKKLVFRKVDKDWNCALHLASVKNPRPWPIPGDALQMQWEINWYQYVETFMPPRFFLRTNTKNETPDEVFTENHKELVKSGGQWLTNTATACSVVAVLIATVAFATSTTVPGGNDESSGKPKLENHLAFQLFAIFSLVALCFSITALVMFLSILTSRYQEKDFGKDLPRKLFLGLTSLFLSIASIIGSFCSGHFFVLEDKLKYAAFPGYAVTCLPVTIFAFVQFPLYVDLMYATFMSVF